VPTAERLDQDIKQQVGEVNFHGKVIFQVTRFGKDRCVIIRWPEFVNQEKEAVV
jgi:hypothetical protein